MPFIVQHIFILYNVSNVIAFDQFCSIEILVSLDYYDYSDSFEVYKIINLKNFLVLHF